MLDPEDYVGREQTYVKHFVLSHYLEKLTFKIGWNYDGLILNYVDCFAGPWQHTSDQLKDTSPYVAIKELVKVRDILREKHGKNFEARCLFIEQDPESFRALNSFLKKEDQLETEAIEGDFESSVPCIIRWAKSSSADGAMEPFNFFFIDPTGWTGFALDYIRPLLQLRPGEVIINFMTSFIKRFVGSDRPEDLTGFERLFGDRQYRQDWAGKSGIDREEAIVAAYCQRVKEAGDFEYVVPSIVLDPGKDSSHFHLIYATRSPVGLRTFRDEVERKAFKEQEGARIRLRQNPDQGSLFPESELTATDRYLFELRSRFEYQARQQVQALLLERMEVSYDQLVEVALAFPLVHSQKLKAWLSEWKRQQAVKYVGLGPRDRVPKPNKGHRILVTGPLCVR